MEELSVEKLSVEKLSVENFSVEKRSVEKSWGRRDAWSPHQKMQRLRIIGV